MLYERGAHETAIVYDIKYGCPTRARTHSIVEHIPYPPSTNLFCWAASANRKDLLQHILTHPVCTVTIHYTYTPTNISISFGYFGLYGDRHRPYRIYHRSPRIRHRVVTFGAGLDGHRSVTAAPLPSYSRVFLVPICNQYVRFRVHRQQFYLFWWVILENMQSVSSRKNPSDMKDTVITDAKKNEPAGYVHVYINGCPIQSAINWKNIYSVQLFLSLLENKKGFSLKRKVIVMSKWTQIYPTRLISAKKSE